MKREGFGDLITAKQRKQNMTMEHDNLVQKSQEMMDSASKEFLQILDELVAFKFRAEQGIAEMERSVAEELEAARREMAAAIEEGT
ncbi:MAG: hypothetical protein BJ554DRAFT_1372 [Olpidium bornovanus]|uniref:Uncharacterized protein n=1 Tax=Olpidium bornovanus TaxID=278681 RepID=A0A8H7ZSF6_9FUNG|nr:MAG: hypothetical protein BJ554DRAFT_1372 [Olpidium bornovanus]